AAELRAGFAALRGPAVGWVIAGSWFPSLLTGGLFALWVLAAGGPALVGHAPVAALVVLLAGTMTVSALPVLARILADRRMTAGRAGLLALGSAVVGDAMSWIGLAVAVALVRGTPAGVAGTLGLLVAGLLAAYLVRRLMGAGVATALCR